MKWGDTRDKAWRFYTIFVLIVIAITVLGLFITADIQVAGAENWGYAQEQTVKSASKGFVRMLRSVGVDATFRFFEDGSWQIVGCVSDGLCQD